MPAERLFSRAIVRLSPEADDEDVADFLQGLVTQDVTGDLPAWTGLLTPQGKALFDFIVWPAGHGEVEFRAQEESGGCRLVMTEKPVSGPVALLPSAVADAMLHPRNAEALRRLKLLAEKRA